MFVPVGSLRDKDEIRGVLRNRLDFRGVKLTSPEIDWILRNRLEIQPAGGARLEIRSVTFNRRDIAWVPRLPPRNPVGSQGPPRNPVGLQVAARNPVGPGVGALKSGSWRDDDLVSGGSAG